MWPDCAESERKQLLQKAHHVYAAREVGELDVIYVDVSPSAGLLVHDLDVGALALELAYIPRGREKPFIVPPGRCPDDLFTDYQPYLRGGMRAAADEETNEVPLDG